MVGTKVKHSELRQAVKDLQNRGLLHSARWAAEQLYGLEDESPEDAAPASAGTVTPAARAPDDEDDAMELETPVSGGRGRGTAGAAGAEGDEQRWRGAGCSPDSAGDDYVLAKAYFDLGEHRRASHQLSENRTSLGRFLRYYALYLAGEKRKNEEMLEQSPSGKAAATGAMGGAGSATVRGGAGASARAERASARNPELDTIDFDLRVILSDASEQNVECRDDPFLRYLHGLVLIEKDRKDEARDALAAAARGYPCHWGAWEALMPLCASAEEAEALPLPRHWMRKWFLAALQLELQENRKGLQAYAGLVLDIPASSVGVVQMLSLIHI